MREGIIGNVPIDLTVFGDPSGSVPAAPYLGPVNFTSATMEADVNMWIADSSLNFGWLIVGDEQIADADRSSNRGFASREHLTNPPTLSFEYAVVPEPSMGTILMLSVGILCFHKRGRTRMFSQMVGENKSR